MTLDNPEWDPMLWTIRNVTLDNPEWDPVTLDNQEWAPVTLDYLEWAPVTLANGSQVSTADVDDSLSIAASNDDNPQRPSNYDLDED